MDEVRYNGEKTEPRPLQLTQPASAVVDDDMGLGPEYKYSQEANEPDKQRVKRSTQPLPNPNSKKSCALYIQTDPLFWKHVKEQVRQPLSFPPAKKMWQNMRRIKYIEILVYT